MSVNFVTESSIEETRKKRQEEWERVRKPSDPMEAPEQTYNRQTLYDRLQEQKNRKQEEYEESKKLKNFVKGLENDEVEFLQNVDEQKAILKHEKYQEEMDALEEFKKTKTNSVIDEQDQLISQVKKDILGFTHPKNCNDSLIKKSTSQTEKLSKLIKRKDPSTSCSNDASITDLKKYSQKETSPKKIKIEPQKSNALASLCDYGSSDSD